MNKNKRTLISMIVFITVFCISTLFQVPDFSNKKEDTSNEAAFKGAAVSNETVSTVTEKEELESFSYGSNSDTLIWMDPSLLADDSNEPAEHMDKEIQTKEAGTTETEASPASEADSTKDIESKSTAEPEEKKPLYGDIGISTAANFVYIRSEASTESEILGKLYKDSAVEIKETVGDWYRVESGSVKGFVNSDYIQTKIPDEELVEKYGELSILVSVDGLNVREKADIDAPRVAVIYLNEIYPVIETKDDWIKINLPEDKTQGYVNREFTDLIVDFKDAVSKEEEAELLKLQEEALAKKETEIKQQESVNYTQEELKLLACLVHAEAGSQSYEGKLAVANVVLNRVSSPKYGGTIKSVIYQAGQFSVARSGSLSKQLANYSNYSSSSQKLSIKAAKAALEGSNNIGSRLYFHSYKVAVKKGYDDKKNSVKLGDHLFW